VVDAPVVRLVLWDGEPHGATYHRSHPNADVALLAGPDPGARLSLAQRLPQPREPVWAIGFPGESRAYGQAVPLTGKIHVNSGTDGLLWIEGVAFHGHSGSPVFDRSGGVVGVLVGVHRIWLDISIAEPVSMIRAIIGGCR